MDPPDEDEGAAPSVGDTSFKHVEVDDYAGGASRLGKAAVGSAALTAALTLHPCVFVSGFDENTSKGVLEQIFSAVGPCTISILAPLEPDDDEPAPPAVGEASVTYSEAAHAVAAIQRFDGSPFDAGKLSVSAWNKAAQGSLMKRGRGRNADKLTHHDRQQHMLRLARAEQAQSEKDAFASARTAALTAAAKPVGPRPTVLQAQPAGGGLSAAGEGAAKRQKANSGLPKCCLVAKSSSASAPAPAAAAAAPAAAAPVAAAAESGGGLLGLGDYGSDEDEE